MMPNMMNGTTMSGLALFWTGTGVLFFLLLIILLLWLFIRWMNAHHTYATQATATRPHPSYQDYQQGYPPQAPEISQEEKSYNTSPQATYEQPSACYPQEMQAQEMTHS